MAHEHQAEAVPIATVPEPVAAADATAAYLHGLMNCYFLWGLLKGLCCALEGGAVLVVCGCCPGSAWRPAGGVLMVGGLLLVGVVVLVSGRPGQS